MSADSHIEVRLARPGGKQLAQVLVNGKDVSDSVRSITVEATGLSPAVATLEVYVDELKVQPS